MRDGSGGQALRAASESCWAGRTTTWDAGVGMVGWAVAWQRESQAGRERVPHATRRAREGREAAGKQQRRFWDAGLSPRHDDLGHDASPAAGWVDLAACGRAAGGLAGWRAGVLAPGSRGSRHQRHSLYARHLA